jgi:probable HAF family extracellular repeat protein
LAQVFGWNQMRSVKPTIYSFLLLMLMALGWGEAQAQLRIMPMGDSITHGDALRNSYRRPLWQMLTNAGLNVDFVGTFTNNVGGPPPNPDFDRNHQSVAGYKVEDILAFMDDWMAENKPDVVLLHIGTNDRLAGQTVASTTNEISQVIDRLRVANAGVKILVAQVIPYTSAYHGLDTLPALNAAIAQLALDKSTPQSPVFSVDQFTGYNATNDNYDGLHPNAGGELKMATNWFQAITNLLGTGTNIAPVTEVLEPQNGQTFLAPTTIRLEARAFDIDGTVTNVEFFANGTLLGETNAAPYSFVITNPPLGTYNYWIVARDQSGLATTSSVVTAYVNPVPAYFRGINLNGPAVTIEGKSWLSGAAALGSGLSATAGGTFSTSYGFPLSPPPDTNTYTMLSSGWVRAGVVNGQGLNITQTVTNGFYHVWIHTMENNSSRYRNMNVVIEGNPVATNIGNLNLGEWRAYGPYLSLVNDGVLNIDLLRYTKGEPMVCGLVIAQATFPTNSSNLPPTISSIPNQTINEDTSAGPISVTVSDPDNSPGQLLLSASSSNQSLLPNGSIVVGGSGSNRSLTLTPAPNANGSATVSVFVADPFGGLATNSFVLTVNPVEDPPTVSISSPVAGAIIAPGVPVSISVAAADPENALTSVTLLGDGLTLTNWTAAPFTYNWTNAALGPHELRAIATDAAGLSTTSAIVAIQVAVPPQYFRGINLAGPSTVVEGQTWLSDTDAKNQGFSVTNGSAAFSGYSFTLTPVPDSGTLSMLQGRYYRINPPNGQGINMAQTITNGFYEVSLWVLEDFQDNQRSMNVFLEGTQVATNIGDLPKGQWAKYGPYPIAVTDGLLNIDVVRSFKGDALIMGLAIQSAPPPESNTPPTISGLTNQSTFEDVAAGPFSFVVSDAETLAGSLTLSAQSSNPTLIPTTNFVFGGSGSNRTVTIIPAPNQYGSATLSVVVSDPYGASATNSFGFTVTPVNDAPVVAITSPGNLAAYNPPANITITASASDVDNAIASVSFYGGANLLGTRTNAPYSFVWTNAPLGFQSLRAVATDALGLATTSAVVTVNVTTEPAYFRGVNLVGPAVMIEGQQWLSDAQARASGMTVTNASQGSGGYSFTITPAVDADTQTMLEGRYYVLNPPPGQGFYIAQTLPNGNYEVFVWSLEDLENNFRAFHLVLEGVQVATNIGDLPKGQWAKYGPYPVTVSDGQLNINAIKGSKGDPLLNGFLIRSAVPPNVPPTVAITAPTNNAIINLGDPILLTASAGDSNDAVVSVTFRTNGATFATLSNAPYNVVWSNAPEGQHQLTAVAMDSFGAATTSAVVSVLVTNINDAPIATNMFLTVTEDVALPITLNVADPDSTHFTFTIVTNPANGSLLNFNTTNGTLTYLPATNYFGTDAFAYAVNDGQATSAVAVVSLTITNVNDAPVATALALGALEDSPLPVALGATDVDSTNFTFTIVTNPAHGTLLNFNTTNGTLTYLPATNYFGADAFAYAVNDGQATSAVAVVSLTITNVNDAPVATNMVFTLAEDQTLDITLNGTDIDSTNLTFVITATPASGSLIQFHATNGTVTYVPAANFIGADSFSFTVSDGLTSSAPATVSLTVTNVNDAPVAFSQRVTLNTGTNVPAFLALGNLGEVLAEDFDSAASAASYGAVAGYVRNPDTSYQAFRWTQTNGTQLLGDLPGGSFHSYALGIGAGGNVIVGVGNSGTAEAFRWDQTNGMTGLGFLPGGTRSEALDVNTDGTVVVGGSQSAASGPYGEAFRWTTNGMIALGFLPGGNNSGAKAVSADGGVVTGWSDSTGYITEAFRWTTNGMTGLGDLPGGLAWSEARGISADGQVVVGFGYSADGQEAFRWTTNGMIGLGDLPGGLFNSVAFAANSDGSVIVGAGDTELGTEAFYWNARLGMVNLRELLAGLGRTNFANWILQEARAVSADGRTIAGVGINPAGGREAWVVTIPPADDLQLPAEDAPINLMLTAWDPDGPALTFTVVTNPAHGTLSGDAPNLVYTPNTNFVGADQLSYVVSDGLVTSAVATVYLNLTNVADAPLVTLDQPLDGAAFAVGVMISLTATASDADNDLASVTFLTNGAPLAVLTSAPFAVVWSNAPVGMHQLTAVATDLTGLSTTSAVASVAVTNSAPTVAVTSPTNGAIFSVGLPVSFTAAAADAENNLATVQLLANGTPLATFTDAPFAFTWLNAPVGTHQLTAVATDALGLSTTSAVVAIDVVNSAPTVAITSPTNGATFAQGTGITITANASDAESNLSSVQLLADGFELALLTNGPFTLDWTNAPSGTHQLTAVATDALGLSSTSAVVTISVTNAAPTVAITNPTNNTMVVFGSEMLLTANAEDVDGVVSEVKFYAGATLLGTGSGTNYAFLWTNAPLGNAVLTAVATDNFGLSTTSAPVTVAFVLVPQLTIASELDGNALLTLTGETNRTYVISASTNVTDWLPVHTNATTNGTLQWLDTAASPEVRRFYHAEPRP